MGKESSWIRIREICLGFVAFIHRFVAIGMSHLGIVTGKETSVTKIGILDAWLGKSHLGFITSVGKLEPSWISFKVKVIFDFEARKEGQCWPTFLDTETDGRHLGLIYCT